ncbi:sulfite exporter TauE/SafE family protein, partial [Nonomuraea sp. 3-1Str]|uniref:urease accessory protein UreH domain-containing protein n=1 Tax=Nonomuraea sp. 3-1Str TaxID=2929801 RepID=UPI002857E6C4
MQAAALLATGLAAGLLAGTASCTAVQGGLLVGLTDRRPSGPEPDRPAAARMVIGGFLLGRFAAHTALGALLGWLGAAVQPPPAVRAALLVAAGAAVVVFAEVLAQQGRFPGVLDEGEDLAVRLAEYVADRLAAEGDSPVL